MMISRWIPYSALSCRLLLSFLALIFILHVTATDFEILYNTKVRRPVEEVLHPRERIVDRNAIKKLQDQGVELDDPTLDIHPPGHEADLEEYAFFGYWSRVGCGASVVYDDIVLTAAHCMKNGPLDHHQTKYLRFRNKYRDNWEDNGIMRAIAHVEYHPDLDNTNKGAPKMDFLIVKLDSSVLVDNQDDMNPTGVKVVELNRRDDEPSPGDELQAVGFGAVIPDGESPNSNVLMDINLDALSPDTCTSQYGRKKFKPGIMLCVGKEDGSKDTCRGDSGGPILDTDNKLVGVVSWGGLECADRQHAGVASRISPAVVVPWIEEQICRLSAMPPARCNSNSTVSFNHRLPDSFDIGGKKKIVKNADEVFDIEVNVHHDIAPEETSWSFTHLDSYTLLHWQPYTNISFPFAVKKRAFSNLIAGSYIFAISDLSADGICCGYGPGYISITSLDTGDILWEHWGVFEDQVSVLLRFDKRGKLLSSEEIDGWLDPAVLDAESAAENIVEQPVTVDRNGAL